MRYRTLFAIFLLQWCRIAHSQNRLSLSVFTGVGNSWFSGKGASSETDYHTDYLADMASYANNPYGNKTVFVGQVGIQGTLDMKNKWMAALNLQYGNDGGENRIKNIVSQSGTQTTNGEYKRVYSFITVNPTFGKAFRKNNFSVSFQAGLDYAFALTFSEYFRVENSNGKSSLYGYSGGVPKSNDFRLTTDLTTSIKRWGLDVCYKHGLRNYANDDNAKVFSNLFEFKLMYKILSRRLS
jgi:hypothetical protein